MQYIEEMPAGWKHSFSPASAFKDGAPYCLSVELPINGVVRHWGQEFFFDTPVEAEVTVFRAAECVTADISVSARALSACSRCLEPSEVAINSNLRYLFALRGYSKDEKSEEKTCGEDTGNEEVIEIASWDDTIDLGGLIWEVLITALPAVVLCSDECEGLCAECGANLNEGPCGCKKNVRDPRFEGLSGLLEE